MARFYFDVRDGPLFIEVVGIELPNLDIAEQEAIQSVVSIGRNCLPRGNTHDVTVEV